MVKDITVYTKDNCPRCLQLKNIMKVKNINFKEVNIEYEEEAMQEVIETGIREMPALKINGEFIKAPLQFIYNT